MTLLQDVREKFNKLNNRLANILVRNVDEETGEINEDIIPELEGIELKKEEVIRVMGVSFHAYHAIAESIKNDPVVLEAQRKLELAKKYEQTSKSFKDLLAKVVPEGQIVETDEFRISWRKSTVLEIDDFDFEIDELEKTHPELVKITKTLNKAEAKKLNVLPKGLAKIEKKNIQVK